MGTPLEQKPREGVESNMRISLLIVLALAVGCVARKSLFSEDGSPTWAAYETIPEDVNLETEYSTYDVWMELIENAQTSIRVGAFYMDFANGTQYLGHEGRPLQHPGPPGPHAHRRLEPHPLLTVRVHAVPCRPRQHPRPPLPRPGPPRPRPADPLYPCRALQVHCHRQRCLGLYTEPLRRLLARHRRNVPQLPQRPCRRRHPHRQVLA